MWQQGIKKYLLSPEVSSRLKLCKKKNTAIGYLLCAIKGILFDVDEEDN